MEISPILIAALGALVGAVLGAGLVGAWVLARVASQSRRLDGLARATSSRFEATARLLRRANRRVAEATAKIDAVAGRLEGVAEAIAIDRQSGVILLGREKN